MNIKQISAKLFKPAVEPITKMPCDEIPLPDRNTLLNSNNMGREFTNPLERAGCKKPPLPAAAKLTHYTIPDDAAEKIAAMLGALEEDGLGGD